VSYYRLNNSNFIRIYCVKSLFYINNESDCKSANPGSIPGSASILTLLTAIVHTNFRIGPNKVPNIQWCISVQLGLYLRVGVTLIFRL